MFLTKALSESISLYRNNVEASNMTIQSIYWHGRMSLIYRWTEKVVSQMLRSHLQKCIRNYTCADKPLESCTYPDCGLSQGKEIWGEFLVRCLLLYLIFSSMPLFFNKIITVLKIYSLHLQITHFHPKCSTCLTTDPSSWFPTFIREHSRTPPCDPAIIGAHPFSGCSVGGTECEGMQVCRPGKKCLQEPAMIFKQLQVLPESCPTSCRARSCRMTNPGPGRKWGLAKDQALGLIQW